MGQHKGHTPQSPENHRKCALRGWYTIEHSVSRAAIVRDAAWALSLSPLFPLIFAAGLKEQTKFYSIANRAKNGAKARGIVPLFVFFSLSR